MLLVGVQKMLLACGDYQRLKQTVIRVGRGLQTLKTDYATGFRYGTNVTPKRC